MRRGDIYRANLDPTIGSEASKTRPVILVCSNATLASVARSSGVVTIVPLTSNVARVEPFQVLVVADDENGLTVDSKAQVEQIRSIDSRRLVELVGALDRETVDRLNTAIRLHLLHEE